MKNNKFTLITGASRGLGKELALQCAKLNHNLVLVSLPNEDLQGLGENISSSYNVKVYTQEWDLTNDKQLNEFTEWVLNQKINVNFLINNAGIGGTDVFESTSVGRIDTMIQLNMKAMVCVTNQLLPVLKQNKSSYILNIASLAGLSPMPYKVVYAATKAFVSSFSKGLNAELRKTGVSVSVAFPGGMATRPEIADRMNKYTGLIKHSFLPVEQVASICIKNTLKKKTVIIPGFLTKLSAFFLQYIPEFLRFNSLERRIKKEMA